jgi:peptidyl-dipeptidase Dcp
MTYADNRELVALLAPEVSKQRIWQSRNSFKIAKLRFERAQLLGYTTTHFVLEAWPKVLKSIVLSQFIG